MADLTLDKLILEEAAKGNFCYIWGIADDVLRDVYVRAKYRDMILR